jgi:phytoene dehydrogenase-like protein
MAEKSIIIIGAGITGLCTGCYGQMNGYRTQIFEMHDKPGGLCTAWERKGFTIDGCCHWLVGSGPATDFYHFWHEVGALQGRKIINMEQFMRFESSDDKIFTVYTDIDRLEQHMKEISREDTSLIDEFISGIRAFARFKLPSGKAPDLYSLVDKFNLIFRIIPYWKQLSKWTRLSMNDFTSRFQSPLLRDVAA